jgi:hypothetical protein
MMMFTFWKKRRPRSIHSRARIFRSLDQWMCCYRGWVGFGETPRLAYRNCIVNMILRRNTFTENLGVPAFGASMKSAADAVKANSVEDDK